MDDIYNNRIKEIPLYRPGKPPLTFFDSDYLAEYRKTWRQDWGSQSSYARLRAVITHRPGPEAAWGSIDPDFLNLPTGIPDLAKMQAQHDDFTSLLAEHNVEVIPLSAPQPILGTYGIPLRSATYTHETLMVKGGAIICRCAPAYKRGLEYYQSRTIGSLGCPILYTVHGMGFFESSNAVWLDKKSLPLAISQRSNAEGVRQISSILRDFGVEDIHTCLPTGTTQYPPGTNRQRRRGVSPGYGFRRSRRENRCDLSARGWLRVH